MTELAPATERSYRFASLDRTGLLLGLSGAQCALLGSGIFIAGGFLQTGANPIVTLGPLVICIVLAFGAWDGRRLHEFLPLLGRYQVTKATGLTRWRAPLPLLTGTTLDAAKQPALPPFLNGLELFDAGPVNWAPTAAGAGVGIARDRRDRTVSASLPVRGREFSLVERAEQERILASWGELLGGFCTERGAVSRVRVTEWAAPSGVGEHERFLDAHAQPTSPKARASYEALLAQAGPMAVSHEVLLTVTVDLRKIRGDRRVGTSRPEDVANEVLLEELRLLTNRLDSAGLVALPPLSVAQTAVALRQRLDPTVTRRLATRRPTTLAEAAGLVGPWNAGPLATESEWDHLMVDGSLHRTYWIAEWPRLDVPPNWLEPMLLHSGGVRTFSLHYEPVPPSRSQRRVDRDSTRLAADEEQRTRGGFRIGARHRRAQADVLEREAELVAGFYELEYAGFVTVSAPDHETLQRSCAEYEQVAAKAGLEIRALDGRHDLGFVCSLPVGRGLAPKRGIG